MATPYTLAARDYHAAGWSPLPLPHNAKDPVPTGFTGVEGEYVSERQVLEWLRPKARCKAGNLNYPPGNIALRLPATVLGIDVDAYGTKRGAETLERAEEEWGQLPPTYVSTSRADGISGIRFFRIPEGLEWPGELPQGKGVELLRWDHRYAIVAPSTNPANEGLRYLWYLEEDPDDDSGRFFKLLVDEFPGVEDLPSLPKEWVTGLTQGKVWKTRAVGAELSASELQAWLGARPYPDAPCEAMRATITKYTRELRKASDDGGGHDAGRDAAWAVLGDAKAGHCGVVRALTELRNVFLAAVRERRADEGAAKSEWARAVGRGVQKVTADDNPEIDEDPCGSIRNLRPRGEGGRLTSQDIVWRLDDVGNAERLIRVADGRARWVEEYKAWYIWDGQRWAKDVGGKQMARWAVKAVNQMAEELAFLEGEKSEAQLKAFKAHMKSSGNAARLTSMVSVASARKGIMVPADRFNAHPALIACTNGTIELGDDGWNFRDTQAEDYLTLNTGVEFIPDAKHELWDDYLKRFFPDEEVRDWLQRLVGYSLFGDNNDQLLIVGLGLTSTGKTTLTEMILESLGGYAGPLEASLLRANADDKPRPDILKAMPRRIVIAEELSEFQNLHVDQVKRITGAGTLSARGMAKDEFVERRVAFTPWLMTNEVPTIEGADAALRSRVLVVPFDVFVPRSRKSARIRATLLREAKPAVLAWAVAGWEKYVSSPLDIRSAPASALAASLKFQAGLSDFHAFLADVTDVGDDCYELPMRLYEAYEAWCSQNKIKEKDQLTVTKFGRRLAGLGFDKGKRSIDGKQVWVREGIRVTDRWAKLL